MILREVRPSPLATRQELKDRGLTRGEIHRNFHNVLRGVYHTGAEAPRVRPDSGPARTLTRWQRERRYQLTAIERAHAYHLLAPGAVATGFTALALAGMKYFVDEQPTAFKGRARSYTRTFGPRTDLDSPGNTLTVQQVRGLGEGDALWRPDKNHPELRALVPLAAAAEIISELARGTQRIVRSNWHIPRSLRSFEVEVRQVQIFDATLRLLPASPVARADMVRAAQGFCAETDLQRTLKRADPGSESPQETIMRLLLKKPFEQCGYAYVTQVGLLVGDRQVTVADALLVRRDRMAAVREMRAPAGWPSAYPCRVVRVEECGVGVVALMFDGQHHLDRSQRDVDSTITAELQVAGLPALRVTAGMLDDAAELIRSVRAIGGLG